MKTFIFFLAFFLFYFVTVKDIYDQKTYLTEDVRILENEVGKRDSILLNIRYQNFKLNEEIKKLKLKKTPLKKTIKPIDKKQEVVIKEFKTEIADTTKK